jgi:exosome complex component RRP40
MVDAKHPNLKLGPGLLQLPGGPLISTKAGTLRHNQNRSKWYVESNSRRVSTKNPIQSPRVYPNLSQYVPAAQEAVIGVVVGKNGAEGFRVDIGGPHNANLDALAFEGATKRNRPNLKVLLKSFFVLPLLTFLGRVSIICASFFVT